MKRIKIVGLALVAVLAMSIVASSASAAGPVFYTKATVGTTAANVPFTGTLGAAFLEGKGGTKITCKAGSAIGEVTGPTTTKGNVTKFTGCETGGVPCENAAAGEIVTNTLQGTLGNVVKEKTPAIRLYDEAHGRGSALANFSCAGGAVAVEVKGSVIGSLTGAAGKTPAEGKFAASNKLEFQESKGVQKYSEFVSGEGEAGKEQLESSVGGGPFEESGQSVTATLVSTPKENLNMTL